MVGIVALAVEFVLGMLVEAGIKLEEACQRRGISSTWVVGLVIFAVLSVTVVFCCAAMIFVSILVSLLWTSL